MTVATQVTPTCLALRATSLLSVSADAANVCGHLGNAPLATVMVEVALYAAYPLILFAPLSDGARAALIGVTFGIGFVLTGATPGMEWWWHNFSLVNFLLFWWIGAWFADLRRPKPTRGILLAIAACWAACTVISLLAPNLPAAELRKIATAILFAALDTPAITSPSLAAMGRTGYSLYAFHMPVMVLAFAFGLSWWVSLGACLLSGILGYLAIERPAIALGQSLVRRSVKRLRCPADTATALQSGYLPLNMTVFSRAFGSKPDYAAPQFRRSAINLRFLRLEWEMLLLAYFESLLRSQSLTPLVDDYGMCLVRVARDLL